jgi:hypothetical protein
MIYKFKPSCVLVIKHLLREGVPLVHGEDERESFFCDNIIIYSHWLSFEVCRNRFDIETELNMRNRQ